MEGFTTISTASLDQGTSRSLHPDVTRNKAMILDSLQKALGKDQQRRKILDADEEDRKINQGQNQKWTKVATDTSTPISYTPWQLALRECLAVPLQSRTTVSLTDLWTIRYVMESGSMPMQSQLIKAPCEGDDSMPNKMQWVEAFCPTIDVCQTIQRETRCRGKGKARVAALRFHVDQLDREYFDGREGLIGCRPKSYPDAFCLGLGGYRIGPIAKKGADKEPLEQPLDYHDPPPSPCHSATQVLPCDGPVASC